jgi:hypothetical protein
MHKRYIVGPFLLTILLAGMALASTAAAATVSYTVGGWGPHQFPAPTPPAPGAPWGPDGYPGDGVELQTYTGTLELTPGTTTRKINTLLWTVDYTYGGTATDYSDAAWSDLLFAISAPRSISVGTSTGNLDQAGELSCTWTNDYLSFAAGSALDFLVVDSGLSYAVHVTPLPLNGVFRSLSGPPMQSPQEITCDLPCPQPPQDMMAQFIVDTPVPVDASSWGRLKMIYR